MMECKLVKYVWDAFFGARCKQRWMFNRDYGEIYEANSSFRELAPPFERLLSN